MDKVVSLAQKLGITGFFVYIRNEDKKNDIKILSIITVVCVILYLTGLAIMQYVSEGLSKQFVQNILDSMFFIFGLSLFYACEDLSRRFGHFKEQQDIQENC